MKAKLTQKSYKKRVINKEEKEGFTLIIPFLNPTAIYFPSEEISIDLPLQESWISLVLDDKEISLYCSSI